MFVLIFVVANLFILTVAAREKQLHELTFHTILTPESHQAITAKKNHFSIVGKQTFFQDTIPATKKLNTDSTFPKKPDSVTIKFDSLFKKDSLQSRLRNDTLPYKLSKNALEDPVAYSAEDSAVVNVPESKVTLYGQKATTHYKDNDVTGPIISFNQKTGDITAYLKRDSTGKVIAFPSYKSGEFSSQSDSFRFNMKTGRGITKSTYTQQGEMYVYGETIKKVNDKVFYALRGRFTTCDLDTPHFAFISNKIKFITGKVAISGPVHPEFEGVPIPIYFPFGIYPLNPERHSGLLPPNFTTNQQRGLGLEDLGYYKVVNDNWDVIFRSSIYSYGGWSANINPRYYKRYKYSGNLAFTYQHFNLNFKGDPDFQKNRSFKLNWSHSADTKSRPGVTFSAFVDASSSSFNKTVPNNPSLNFDNTLQSTISYQKNWIDKPFSLSLAASNYQNTNLKSFDLSLPTASFNVTTIYPFRRKEFAGQPKWYENLGIGYIGSLVNRFSFSDSANAPGVLNQLRKNLRWGARHQIPISLSLPQIGIFQVSPGVSYEETWYQKKSTRYFDTAKDTLITNVQDGFFTARAMSFSLGLSTRFFGMFTSKNKNSMIKAIRHELKPSISLNYTPNLNNRNYYYAVVDTTGVKQIFPYFESQYNINGPYSSTTFAGLNFGLDNNITMKVRNRKDTSGTATKKIPLLDQLSIRGNYNFVLDSFNFSPLSIDASTNLFNKVNVSAGGNLNLYEVNSSGRPVNQLIWKRNPFSLGRLTSASISLSSQFSGGNKKTGEQAGLQPGNAPDLNQYDQDQYNSDLAYIRNNPGEFADFSIPWSVNLSYSLFYNKTFVLNSGFQNSFAQNIIFGGSLALTKKWQMQVNGAYNITESTLIPLSFSISRDLHCWQMSISGSPIGFNRYFSINISPKSPLLRDLKINRTRSFSNYNL
ncbi:MAG: putative LPS assembly protein LptD [Ginsengibacter sp.]